MKSQKFKIIFWYVLYVNDIPDNKIKTQVFSTYAWSDNSRY